VILLVAADDELQKLGLGHLEVIGTRFIDEHHEIHDYPGDKEDDEKHSDDDDSDYHHVIYDHVDISKDDYSDFGGITPILFVLTRPFDIILAAQRIVKCGVCYQNVCSSVCRLELSHS